jgi:hypothetical protein
MSGAGALAAGNTSVAGSGTSISGMNSQGGAGSGNTMNSSSAAGMGGLGGGTPNSATPGDDGTSFETSVQPFINMACNCHQSNPLMAPFSLKTGEAYQAIVNVASSQVTTMMLVKPGSTQESYLWHKVNGTFLDVGGTGMIMPFTIPLTEAEKKIFEAWIVAGAKP